MWYKHKHMVKHMVSLVTLVRLLVHENITAHMYFHFGVRHKNVNENNPHCQRRKCSQGSEFLERYGLCGYSLRFAGERASNESGVVENND